MPNMLHIDPNALLVDTFRLGKKLYETGFRPRHAISIWRGGTPVGLGVDAYFRAQGLQIKHTTIATESFTGIDQRGEVVIKGLEHLVEVVCPEDGLLIIDDVYETGRTIEKIVNTLRSQARANAPEQICVGTVHSKPEKHEYTEIPIVSLRNYPGDTWIDYPHELADLVDLDDPDDSLIRDKDPEIWEIIRTAEGFEPTKVHHDGPYRYISARSLLLEAFRLGVNVVRDEVFFPQFLIALWPGGISAGLPIHEVYKYFLKKKGIKTSPPDHISLNTTRTDLSYRSNIVGIQYLQEHINRHDNVLIIDTAFHSGRFYSDVVTRLKEALRRNLSHDNVRMASIYYNPDDSSTWTVRPVIRKPHYYLRKVDHDIIYPQSVHKLRNPRSELKELDPNLHEVLYT
jgi:hypothetical protein